MWTVIHAAAVFFLLLAVVRIMGKREISEMSAFDLVILFVVGDLVAEAVVAEDTSFTGAVIAMATFALLTVFMSWLSFRSERVRVVVDGNPSVVVLDGEPDLEALRRERITIRDLHEAARGEGIRDLADVELALLEVDGKFSFFSRQH